MTWDANVLYASLQLWRVPNVELYTADIHLSTRSTAAATKILQTLQSLQLDTALAFLPRTAEHALKMSLQSAKRNTPADFDNLVSQVFFSVQSNGPQANGCSSAQARRHVLVTSHPSPQATCPKWRQHQHSVRATRSRDRTTTVVWWLGQQSGSSSGRERHRIQSPQRGSAAPLMQASMAVNDCCQVVAEARPAKDG
jgi:hypothetical protein